MVEELLPVVGQEEDERAVVEPALLEPLTKRPNSWSPYAMSPSYWATRRSRSSGLQVVGPRILTGVAGRGVGLEHAVERRRRGVGDVGVHGVDVEEGRQPAPRIQEGEGRVHHHVRRPRACSAGCPSPCRPAKKSKPRSNLTPRRRSPRSRWRRRWRSLLLEQLRHRGVGRSRGSRSCTARCCPGRSEVKIEATDGFVQEAWATAFSKTIASFEGHEVGGGVAP